jgi:hypothetical protein
MCGARIGVSALWLLLGLGLLSVGRDEEEIRLLFVGDDWAEAHHDVEIQDETGRALARRRLPAEISGIAALHALLAEHLSGDAEPDQVVVGIETDRGPWVQALLGRDLPCQQRPLRRPWVAYTSRAQQPLPQQGGERADVGEVGSDVHPDQAEFLRLGALTMPAALVAAALALWGSLRVIGA